MTIKQIYNLALEMGVAADPRGKNAIEKYLARQKTKYQKCSKDERDFFDRENLTNPYADSRLHFGDPQAKIKTILAGIEAEETEIALVKALDQDVDLIITHHPIGKALAALNEVMAMQADMMASYGVPINIAEGVMRGRIEEVGRTIAPTNHMKTVDAAKLARLPIMNIHTPADNLVSQFLQKLIDRKKPETVGDVIDILRNIPEYKIAALNNAGPQIFAGNSENRVGKIIVDMTGGTSGSKEIYSELARAGVGTIVGMHIKEDHREEAIKNHLNVIIAGHISSDSLGMNLFLDELSKKNIKIIPCGGLIRVKRK